MGMVLLVAGLVLAGFIYGAYMRENDLVDMHMQETGSCFLDDGTCLHAEINSPFYIGGWGIAAAIALFGVYVGFIDNTQKFMEEHQNRVSKALQDFSISETEKDAFNAFLSVFDDDQKRVLKAVYEQPDGIKQSTLRFRTDLSKTGLSLMLKEFEEKGIISRRQEGKTNRVFFVKRF